MADQKFRVLLNDEDLRELQARLKKCATLHNFSYVLNIEVLHCINEVTVPRPGFALPGLRSALFWLRKKKGGNR